MQTYNIEAIECNKNRVKYWQILQENPIQSARDVFEHNKTMKK